MNENDAAFKPKNLSMDESASMLQATNSPPLSLLWFLQQP